MDDHLTRDLFRAIHKGWRDPGDLAAIAMAHLFELCPRCRSQFETWRRELDEGEATAEGHDYDGVVDRLRVGAAANEWPPGTSTDRAEPAAEAEAKRADELLRLPPLERLEWARKEASDSSGILFAEGLIEECRRRTPADPHEGYTLALVARIILQHTSMSPCAIELYGRALAWMANALRVMGDYLRARQVIGDGRYVLGTQGGGDRLARAEIDRLEGSLWLDLEEPRQGIRVLLRALMSYRMEKAARETITVLLKLARAHTSLREIDRAAALVSEAAEVVRDLQDDWLRFLVSTYQARTLCIRGDGLGAQQVIVEARARSQIHDDSLISYRLGSLESEIARQNRQPDLAECILRRAITGYTDHGFPVVAADVSLRLARLYLDTSRSTEAVRLLDAAIPIFKNQELFSRLSTAQTLYVRGTS